MHTGPISRNSPDAHSDSILRRLGFGLLLLLLAIQPCHFVIEKHAPYYREFIAAVFVGLFFIEVLATRRRYSLRSEEILLLLSFLYMSVQAILDTDTRLYGFRDLTTASRHLSSVSPTLYVLRNAALYLPLVLYVSARGLSEREVKVLCITISLAAPVSVLLFLRYRGVISRTSEMLSVLRYGATGLSYNSYVPYLTFPLLTSLYLSMSEMRRLARMAFRLLFLALFSYILVSTSRQSILFSLLVGLWFFTFADRTGKRRIGWTLVLMISLLFVVRYLLASGYMRVERLAVRIESFEGFSDTSRFRIMAKGLRLLSFTDYIWGAGLSSIIVRGPHNDYIRWIQRIGVPGMLLSFMPFILAFVRSLRRIRSENNNVCFIFSSCCLLFLLFHSFFGYPRDDAYQSLYAFLGLVLWLNLERPDLAYRTTAGSISSQVFTQSQTRARSHNS